MVLVIRLLGILEALRRISGMLMVLWTVPIMDRLTRGLSAHMLRSALMLTVREA